MKLHFTPRDDFTDLFSTVNIQDLAGLCCLYICCLYMLFIYVVYIYIVYIYVFVYIYIYPKDYNVPSRLSP